MLEGQATKRGSVEVAKQEAKTTELKVFSLLNFYGITSLTVDMYKKWSTLMVCQANHHNTHTSLVPRLHPAFCHFYSASYEKLALA